jgi:hypothetical protein
MTTTEPIERCEHCLRYVCRCQDAVAQEPAEAPVDWAPWLAARAANA